METAIEQFLISRTNTWAPSTLRSERARFRNLAPYINGDPQTLWTYLEANLKPYTRVTAWSRVVEFWKFCIKKGLVITPTNIYEDWRDENRRLFRNVYHRKPARFSLVEATKKIQTLQDFELYQAADFLLSTGGRFTESGTLNDEGQIVGKGGKVRQLFVPDNKTYPKVSHFRLWKALSQVGLTSHQLRKIFLTELAKQGADVFELCEVAGWSSPNTAMSYIKGARAQERVRELQKRIESQSCPHISKHSKRFKRNLNSN